MRTTSRLFAIVAVAAMAAASAVVHHTERILSATVAFAARSFRFAVDLVLAAPLKGQAETKPRVVLVAARAFVLKQMQRTRPLFTARWRMCPSA